MIKVKHPVFEAKGRGIVKWYAVIDGCFFFWSDVLKGWVSSFDQEQAMTDYLAAQEEGRVMLLTLKGRVIE